VTVATGDQISARDLSQVRIELPVNTAESSLPVLERDIEKAPTRCGGPIITLLREAATRGSSRFDPAAGRLSGAGRVAGENLA